MAIKKDHAGNRLKQNFSYWRYAGVLRFEHNLVIKYYDEPQAGAVICLEGYESEAHRDLVKQGVSECIFHHEFVICNWRELKQETRPSTVAEKKAYFGGTRELTDQQWKDMQHDTVISQEMIEHNDYDKFVAAIGTKHEAKVAYQIFKTHKFSSDFYDGGVDV